MGLLFKWCKYYSCSSYKLVIFCLFLIIIFFSETLYIIALSSYHKKLNKINLELYWTCIYLYDSLQDLYHIIIFQCVNHTNKLNSILYIFISFSSFNQNNFKMFNFYKWRISEVKNLIVKYINQQSNPLGISMSLPEVTGNLQPSTIQLVGCHLLTSK